MVFIFPSPSIIIKLSVSFLLCQMIRAVDDDDDEDDGTDVFLKLLTHGLGLQLFIPMNSFSLLLFFVCFVCLFWFWHGLE